MVGDVKVTYWSYFTIRVLGDIFIMGAITALNSALIIATRETSTGRADVGRQLAWGALGWGLFPLILELCDLEDVIFYPVIVCITLWVLAALVLLIDRKMPLSPPEWWWHTKSGMLAIPMSAIRKYCPEVAALTVVAVVLGGFWAVIYTYQPYHFQEILQKNLRDEKERDIASLVNQYKSVSLDGWLFSNTTNPEFEAKLKVITDREEDLTPVHSIIKYSTSSELLYTPSSFFIIANFLIFILFGQQLPPCQQSYCCGMPNISLITVDTQTF